MHQILKRLFTPLALLVATQIPTVGAEAIRVVGPDGQIQSAPQYSQSVGRLSQPSATYGPTGQSETLWSIATKLRPNGELSVQQTLLAIYRLNPQAFDNQNIHELIKGSRLRIPSAVQVQAESSEEAIRILNEHRAKLRPAANVSARPAPTIPVVTEQNNAQPPVTEKEPGKAAVPAQLPGALAEKEQAITEAKTEANKPSVNTDVLKQELADSEGELLALEEKNHQLRLMLSEVQGEVDNLRDELGDESRIRSEVEKMLEVERQRMAEEQAMQPTMLETLLDNTWALILLALIPGLLLVVIVILLLSRKPAPVAMPLADTQHEPEVASLMDDDVPDIDLDDDLDNDVLLGEDLFDDDSDIQGEAFSMGDGEATAGENDVFANLSESEFNLDDGDEQDPFASIDDNGDLDTGMDFDTSTTGVSVDGNEQALSLEEMERALDEDIAPEEADNVLNDFDLSDDSDDISQDELDNLLAVEEPDEMLDGNELDQSMLDDLFNQVEPEINDDQMTDLDFDTLLSETRDSSQEDELDLADIDDIDALLDATRQQDDAGASDRNNTFAVGEESTELLDDLLEESAEADDFAVGEESTELLDDLLEESAEADDFAVGEESTELLDDLLEESAEADDFAVDEESTELLDDLLEESAEADDFAVDEESTELLDDLLEESAEADDFAVGEESTELLDDLLEESAEADDFAVGEESTELLDDLLEESAEADDFAVGEESTELLDDLLEESAEADDFAVGEESTELLDDLLEESAETDEFAVGEESTELLDDLLEESAEADDFAVGEESSELLDDLLEESEDADKFAVGEESTELLDDLLEESAEADDFAVGEESTELLDDLPEESSEEDIPAVQEGVEEEQDSLNVESLINIDELTDDTMSVEEEDRSESAPHLDLEAGSQELLDELFAEPEAESESEPEAVKESLFDEDFMAALDEHSPQTGLDEIDSFLSEFDEYEHDIKEDPGSLFEQEEDIPPTPATEAVEAENPEAVDSPETEESPESTESKDENIQNTGVSEQSAAEQTEAVPNEFGMPRDSDWEVDESTDDEAALDEFDFPEYGEDEALQDAMQEEPPITESGALESELLDISDDELGEYDEDTALQDVLVEEQHKPEGESEGSSKKFEAFDESATLAELLADDGNQPQASFDEPLDDDTIHSAGMDINAMLAESEDWNGFTLSPEQQADISADIPEDQHDIWVTVSEQPELSNEDWGHQPDEHNLSADTSRFVSVDDLMAQVDAEEPVNPDDEVLNLEVGLNEFPDVIGNVNQFDVDANSEAAGKLDMAKIYIEMNDKEGAIQLLEEAIVYGEDDIRREAKALIDEIKG
ncbi:hypothetical protein CSW98_03690 [Vibrio sp. HA2012]|uniref:FimV/HubP family polar landmark protein n=1 Tax=Vibrio sp. HA2012 TaxID=1971595 RepID=UPI000C2B91CB|nr:FimV/HubP family polar landmark protein [Vibrio sp. HA2012]PJC88230.1 hypothetical protein CSW98_03690 [Vibrio sp. HA2012]